MSGHLAPSQEVVFAEEETKALGRFSLRVPQLVGAGSLHTPRNCGLPVAQSRCSANRGNKPRTMSRDLNGGEGRAVLNEASESSPASC